MIGHYLSSNNNICYSTKSNNFSPTKQRLNVLVSGDGNPQNVSQWANYGLEKRPWAATRSGGGSRMRWGQQGCHFKWWLRTAYRSSQGEVIKSGKSSYGELTLEMGAQGRGALAQLC